MNKRFSKAAIFSLPIFAMASFLFFANTSLAFSNPTVNPTGGAGSIYIEASTPANVVYLKSTGNVGIGNTNPAEKLDVSGDVYIAGTGSTIGRATLANGSLRIGTTLAMDPNELYFGTPAYFGTIGANDLYIDTNGVTRITVTAAGNVGIAKVPTTALDVNGTVTATAFAGPLSGSISSANVSAGSFGANTGGGNYTFPANLTVTGSYNGYTPSKSSSSTNSIYSLDSRSTNHLPQDRNAGLYADFRVNSTDGLADGGTYHGVLTFRSYGSTTDFSGGQAMQLGYTDNSNMWTRFGSAATWGSWRKLIIADTSGGIRLDTTSVPITIRETDQTLPVGLWRIPSDGGGLRIDMNTAAAGDFSTYSTPIAINSSGNVGIKTTAPTVELEVNGTVKATAFSGPLSGTITAANVSSGTFGANTGGGIYTFPSNLVVNGGDIKVADTAGQTQYTIKSYNNGSTLWLIGGTGQQIVLADSLSWDRSASISYSAGTTGSAAGVLSIGQTSKNGTTYTHGITDLYTNGTNRLRIDSAGNVGIGNTAPAYKLDVAGDIHATGWVRTDGTNGWYSQTYGGGWFMQDTTWVRTYNAKGVWTNTGPLGSDGGLTIGYGGAAAPTKGAIISGSVGIGTSTPGMPLDVVGNARATTFYGSGAGLTGTMLSRSAGSSVDLNNLVSPGTYRVDTTLTNKPTGASDYGQLLVAYGASDTIGQIYFSYNANSYWIRSGNPTQVGGTGTWQPWRQFVTSDTSGNTDTCRLVSYSSGTTTSCPAGFYTWSGTALASGYMLCCRVSNPI